MKTLLNQNEKIVKEGGGNLIQNGVGFGGKLHLTNQRIVFEAHKLNLESISVEIELSNIQSLEKNWSKLLGRIPIINNELTVHTKNAEKYQFVLFGRDSWMLAIDALRVDSTSQTTKTLDGVVQKPIKDEISEVTVGEKTDANNKVVRQQDDPEILKKLQKYQEHTSVFCIMCGYDGLMGIEGKHIPWYLTWWVLIPLLLTGIGIIPAIALGLWRANSEKYSLKCPNCDADLVSQ